jgi:hypothetical protein
VRSPKYARGKASQWKCGEGVDYEGKKSWRLVGRRGLSAADDGVHASWGEPSRQGSVGRLNQIGTLTSYVQQMVIGAFVIVVVAAQTYLARKRTY